MLFKELEKSLSESKFQHLTENVLASYQDQKLDNISRTQADVHLRLCLICERRLLLLQEEKSAIESLEATGEDTALDEQQVQK